MNRAAQEIAGEVEYLLACLEARDERLSKRCAARLAKRLIDGDHDLEVGLDLDLLVLNLCKIAATDRPLF